MPLHIIKLCVGCDSLAELADWQKKRLKEKRAKGQKPELIHVTRQMPKRAEELLEGGSLYWVIRGQIMARQTLLELREVKKNGIPHCGLVYDKRLVPLTRLTTLQRESARIEGERPHAIARRGLMRTFQLSEGGLRLTAIENLINKTIPTLPLDGFEAYRRQPKSNAAYRELYSTARTRSPYGNR